MVAAISAPSVDPVLGISTHPAAPGQTRNARAAGGGFRVHTRCAWPGRRARTGRRHWFQRRGQRCRPAAGRHRCPTNPVAALLGDLLPLKGELSRPATSTGACPTFVWVTAQDPPGLLNALAWTQALADAGAAVELHVYPVEGTGWSGRGNRGSSIRRPADALANLASRVQYPYLVGMALAEQTAEPETICSAGLWVVVVVDARHGEPSQSSGRAHTLAASSLPPLQVRVRVRPPWWRCRESNPGPPSHHQGFSVRSPLRLCSDPPVTRTSRCDDPSRCRCPARPRGRIWR